MKSMIKKLRSAKGESLGETLVSVLIASLAILTLTNFIVKSATMSKKGSDELEKYYHSENLLAIQDSSALMTNGDSVVTGSAELVNIYNSNVNVDDIFLNNNTGISLAGETGISLRFYENKEAGSTKVISYSAASTGGSD